jgi:hypothetical protein
MVYRKMFFPFSFRSVAVSPANYIGFGCMIVLLSGCGEYSLPASALQTSAVQPAAAADGRNDTPASSHALALFQRRILPILKADKPSSCTECHISSVDLKNYIDPDQAKTFASLVAGGLIDSEHPDESKILQFISRSPAQSELTTRKMREREYEAFRAWIHAAVKDPMLLAAQPDDSDLLGAPLPVEVIRHARTDRVLSSFIENVWSEVGRCAGCHSPDRNQKTVEEWGEQVSWIKLGDPQATLRHMLDEGLIDVDTPETSPILTKPTLQQEHGGGQKMIIGDTTYVMFRRFLDDYSAVAAGRYRTADEIPQPPEEVSRVSDIWMHLNEVPEELDQVTLRVNLYRWLEEERRYSKERWATADRAIWGQGRRWGYHLTLTAPRGSQRAEEIAQRQQLPAGRYLVRIYLDRDRNLQEKYPYELGERELYGQMEIESRWQPGHGRSTQAKFPEK